MRHGAKARARLRAETFPKAPELSARKSLGVAFDRGEGGGAILRCQRGAPLVDEEPLVLKPGVGARRWPVVRRPRLVAGTVRVRGEAQRPSAPSWSW